MANETHRSSGANEPTNRICSLCSLSDDMTMGEEGGLRRDLVWVAMGFVNGEDDAASRKGVL